MELGKASFHVTLLEELVVVWLRLLSLQKKYGLGIGLVSFFITLEGFQTITNPKVTGE